MHPVSVTFDRHVFATDPLNWPPRKPLTALMGEMLMNVCLFSSHLFSVPSARLFSIGLVRGDMWYCNTSGLLFRGPRREGIWMSVSEWFSPARGTRNTLKEPAQVTRAQNATAPWQTSQKPDTGDTPARWDTLTQTCLNKYSTSARHPRASRVLIYLKYRVNVAYPISRVRWSISVT